MTGKSFVHLHLHSEYSILDGMCRLDRLLEAVEKQGMASVAVTDHGNMFGALDFYTKARKVGIKPILGCEVYITSGSRFDKSSRKNSTRGSEGEGAFGGAYSHLTLLCKDVEGYRNLLRLCTAAYTEGFYYKPRIDKEILREYSKGLIGFSGCLAGEVCRNLVRDDIEKARKIAEEYREIFGEENFYMEIMSNGLADQLKANRGVIELAEELGLPLVATNDAHYIDRSDAEAHHAMVCIQTGTLMDDPDGLHFGTDEFYLKSPEQMWEELGEYEEALKNTVEIANRCNVEIPGTDGKLVMPRFESPDGKDNFAVLRELAYEGAWNRYHDRADDEDWIPGRELPKTFTPMGEIPPPPGDWEAIREKLPRVVRERVDYELEILKTKGYVEYFLIVWDFVHFARERGIAVGPGRGSAAGSIVAYCLTITDIDPLAFGLIFERFLNPERPSPPDIDTDFSDKRREEVIRYCAERYGEDCVAQIATFSRMGAKQVVRDVARVLGLPASEGNRIAKAIPDDLNIKLQEALEKSPDLQQIREEDALHERLFEIALLIEGTIRQTSVHAAGIVIAPESLIHLCPLMKTNNGEVCSQFEHKHLEALGLVKMDFLGLKTLSVIEDTILEIRKTEPDFQIEKIPLDDPKTFELLRKGRTNGVFQLESAGMKDLIKKLQPESFQDVIPLVALFRPGPLKSGMVDKFIARKHGAEPIEYDHPDLEPILAETYGTILYQEQVMKIANKIAGYSLGEADVLRRAMGKKNAELLAAEKEKFLSGAAANGYDRGMADRLFDTIEYFAGYGFNKSHSAAYGVVAYQTAYLKANYPAQFMAAVLTNDRNNTNKVVNYVRDCREMGIPVLPPDINQSHENFTVTPSGIRFGLTGIKGVGDAAVGAILREREKGGPFKDLQDFCERVDGSVVNSKIIECLIRSGAMVSFGKKRSQLLAVYPEAMESASSLQRDRSVGQATLFGDFGGSATPQLEYPDIPELEDHEILADEKALLGIYVTGHPLAQFTRRIRKISTHSSQDLAELKDGREFDVRIAGILTAVQKRRTGKGEPMAQATVEDLDGVFQATVFPQYYESVADLLYEGNIVVTEGRAREGKERTEVVVRSMKPLDASWQGNVKAVHVRLMSEGLKNETLESLKRTFQRHPGNAEVVFHVRTPRHGEVVIRTGGDYRVAPTADLETQVEDLIEENAVDYEIRAFQPSESSPSRRNRYGRRNGF